TGRNDRRVHPGVRRRAGLGIHLVRLPGCGRIHSDHPGLVVQAYRSVSCSRGENRMKKSLYAVVVLVALSTVPYWLHVPYYQPIVIATRLFIVGAVSMNLLLGDTGQLNLGHIAFFGIGAYVSALTSLGFDIPAFSGDGR